MGWGGMNVPSHLAPGQIVGPGPQDGHSPMEWGGINAPEQPAARNRAGSIVFMAGASQEVLSGPALVDGTETKVTTARKAPF